MTKQITINHFIYCYEQMNGKITTQAKNKIVKYALKKPKNVSKLSLSDLKLIRAARELQLEILEVSGCDVLEIVH